MDFGKATLDYGKSNVAFRKSNVKSTLNYERHQCLYGHTTYKPERRRAPWRLGLGGRGTGDLRFVASLTVHTPWLRGFRGYYTASSVYRDNRHRNANRERARGRPWAPRARQRRPARLLLLRASCFCGPAAQRCAVWWRRPFCAVPLPVAGQIMASGAGSVTAQHTADRRSSRPPRVE